MSYPNNSSGMGKSLALAGFVVLVATMGVLVYFTQTSSQDVRSRASELYPTVPSCPSNTKPTTCPHANQVPFCSQYGNWICVAANGNCGGKPVFCGSGTVVVCGTGQNYTCRPAPTPRKLSAGERCGNNCYGACNSGVGWNSVCRSRASYCRAYDNRVTRALYGLGPIECP